MKKEHMDRIDNAIKAVAAKNHINHFYFVACGGSQAFMMPAQYIMDMETEIPASIYTSNEFVHTEPKALGPDSVVITCSHSGNTPETVKATELARKKGALTIALSNLVDSPLWLAAEYPLHYDWGKEADASDMNKGVLYTLLFKILNVLSPCEKYDKAINAVDHLGECIGKAKELYDDKCAAMAADIKDLDYHMVVGSGMLWGEAYDYAMCVLEEMQWVKAQSIHAAEFFHGLLEICEKDTSMILFYGDDETRPLMDRVMKFVKNITPHISVFDTAEVELPFSEKQFRAIVSPLVTYAITERLSCHLEKERNHPLTARRYYRQMDY